MGDLKTCKDDCLTFSGAMTHYAAKPITEHWLADPSLKECIGLMNTVNKKFRDEPDKNFLLMIDVAGHGMNCNGQQVLLINEFDPNSKWYKFW